MSTRFGWALLALASLAVPAPRGWAAPEATGRDTAVGFFDGLVDLVRAEGAAPMVAARIYGYSSVAFFETLVAWNPRLRSLAGQLNGFGPATQPGRSLTYDPPTAALGAAAAVARALLAPESRGALDALEKRLADERYYRPGVSAATIDRSLEHGRGVATDVLEWASGDGFGRLTNCPYVAPSGVGLWERTPPAFAAPLQPCWGALRPMVLAHGASCQVAPPPAYSETPGSAFHDEAREVWDVSRSLTPEQRTIALFWADNPRETGTPAGHWVRIVGQFAVQQGLDLVTAAEAYARTGIAVNDAFIACWHTKYTYNLVRPITVLRRLFDANWTPLVATPPFPEYTSGHSTQSGASASILSDQFGARGFTDATHAARGLAARSFPSFEAAAREAAISRLYGGIHFRAAIDVGLEQGRCVASQVLARVRFRN